MERPRMKTVAGHNDESVLNSGTIHGSARGSGVSKDYSGWNVYNNEAKKVDTELVSDWRGSLNSLLLFAAIFAAVLTAFIIESKKMLQQDPNEMMVDVMIFYTNNVANGTHVPYVRPTFEPDAAAISINCLFFASLSGSLVAALASVVALQWVADYDAALTRGGSSPEDRAKRRQFRYAGVVSWRMNEIIAALPILLYGSVILFFSGLIYWMSVVHRSVAAVVVTGAAVAVIFYGASTFLAVAFVSAPFRTPLSRWIYSFIHFLLSLLYRLALALRIASGSQSEKLNLVHDVSRKREDHEVDHRTEMGMKALVWLSSQLSISQDSYNRLLLLVSELPKLSQEDFALPGFKEAPWYSIFDLLGLRSLKLNQCQGISTEEIHTVATLVDCYRLPAVYDLVRPTESMVYLSDDTTNEYWSQYCYAPGSDWSKRQYKSAPNSLFLLLRDIPLPTRNTSHELELTIRLSRWRNSLTSSQKEENEASDYTTYPSNTPSEASVVLVGQFFKEGDMPSWLTRNRETLYTTLVRRMIPTLVRGTGKIFPKFLDLLRWNFETLLVGESSNTDDASCLSNPLQYSEAFRKSASEMNSLHNDFTLLLARNLNDSTTTDKSRRVKEVITMIWAQFGYVDAHDIHQRSGMENFFDTNKATLGRWINRLGGVPHIREILQHLAATQATVPEIGPLWRVAAPRSVSDPRLFEVLDSFDRVIRHGVTPAQHLALVDLVCQDLSLGPPEVFAGYYIGDLVEDPDELEDPCLRALAVSMGTLGSQSEYLPLIDTTSQIDSWTRIATYLMKQYDTTNSPAILQMKAALWHLVPDQRGHYKRALQEPQFLDHLSRIFKHPIICSEHQDLQGHLLLHIFETVPHCEFFVDMTEFTIIPMKGRLFDVLLMLTICLGGQDELPLPTLHKNIEPKCLLQVLELIEVVKQSQFALLGLLFVLAGRLADGQNVSFITAAEDLAAVSICVSKALSLPKDSRVVPIVRPLVQCILRARKGMLAHHYRSAEENQAVSKEVMAVVDRLMAHIASMSIFGASNCRMLSCARTSQTTSPALGWLPIYID